MTLTKTITMLFNYKFKQKSGLMSVAQVNLDDVILTKVIKIMDGEQEKEVLLLELKHTIQQPVEVPVEQAATKEQRMAGVRNISHSKWELGWVPMSVSIEDPEDVTRFKEIRGL